MRATPWIGVDLDGTLVIQKEDHWDERIIGEPVPLMVKRVKSWLKQGVKVKIFTARVGTADGRDPEPIRKIIADWTERELGQRLEVTNEKDYAMLELWDDRAVQVEFNTGRAVRSGK